MFPERVALRCAALSDPAYQHNTIDFWENIYGYRMWPAGWAAIPLFRVYVAPKPILYFIPLTMQAQGSSPLGDSPGPGQARQ